MAHYLRASQLDEPEALNNLGILYEEGVDGHPDYARARDLYKKAAEKGNTNALVNLALLYDKGKGVEKNPDEANKLLASAADQGNLTARSIVGKFFNASTLGIYTERASASGVGESYAGATLPRPGAVTGVAAPLAKATEDPFPGMPVLQSEFPMSGSRNTGRDGLSYGADGRRADGSAAHYANWQSVSIILHPFWDIVIHPFWSIGLTWSTILRF
eukprot:TRINITY_DN8232_c0_g1_i2.p1 TRINITY_DN8232_c0_g1~~TRINITY_DN8232_c0_g1_i2.p1  ORF type:complete len:216 (+),score=28.87 TRINITY_DN8232_c0_g1_i2:277-924(+)